MYIVKVAGYNKKRGDRVKYVKSVDDFTVEENCLITTRVRVQGAVEYKYDLEEGDRVYIMDTRGTTVDKYIVDSRK